MVCFDLGYSIDWTAASAVVSAVMVIATFLTLYYNRKQFLEFKRQWEESNRARLVFSIATDETTFLLKIENIGKNAAYNVCIKINESFLNCMLQSSIKEYLTNNISQITYIPAGRCLYLPLSAKYHVSIGSIPSDEINTNIDILKNESLHIKGKYNDLYEIDEIFTIDSQTHSIVVKPPLANELEKINNTLKSLCKKKSLNKLLFYRVGKVGFYRLLFFYRVRKVSFRLSLKNGRRKTLHLGWRTG